MSFRIYDLPHYNERPETCTIDTIIVHSMYAKSARSKTDALACFQTLDACKVSSHYSIARDGTIWQHVPADKRAWHAGESAMPADGRTSVNDFSIGIELVGRWGSRFTGRQYRALVRLIRDLKSQFPLRVILGHQEIAPQRKVDPGPSFDWQRLKRELTKGKVYLDFQFDASLYRTSKKRKR